MHHHAFMHSCIIPISNLLFIARACMLSDFILIFFVSDNYLVLYCLLLSLTNSTCISLTNQFHILLMLYPLCGHAATVYTCMHTAIALAHCLILAACDFLRMRLRTTQTCAPGPGWCTAVFSCIDHPRVCTFPRCNRSNRPTARSCSCCM